MRPRQAAGPRERGGDRPAGRPRVVLTIGKLDGVHAGHRHLLAHTQAEADRLGARSAAVMLHPDPVTVLTGRPVERLTTIEDRAARLRAFGIDVVEPLRFTREVSELAPEAFIDRLAERFDIAGMVVGSGFAFGHDRRGNTAVLAEIAARRGFFLRVEPPLALRGEPVSSRRVREVIAAGDIDLARRLLRQAPRMVGTVVHGAARGRSLGYPTANLDPTADFAAPANGIYAVRAGRNSGPEPTEVDVAGVASIGVRPTFDRGMRLLEVHLFGFDEDLYGRELTVDFLAFQRPELRFASIEALVAQMDQDARDARAIHAREAARPWSVIDARAGAVCVAGHDLAALCTHAAAAAKAAPPGRPLAGRAVRRQVSLAAAGDEALLDAWLRHLAGMPRAPLRAEVYHAGDGSLHALTAVAEAGGAPAGPTAVRTAGVRRRPDGWLETEITVGERAAARSAADRGPSPG